MAFNPDYFKDIYPFSPEFFTHKNGIKQHYIDEGEGEPMVMVHGNPSWSFLFRDMIKEFRSDFRTIAVDHVGCGLSDKPSLKEFSYCLTDHIENLEALIDNLDLDQPITLVVHDWGGAIGMGYASRHPKKIKRIIAMNTAAFRLPKGCMFPWPLWLFRHTDLGACLNQTFNAFAYVAAHTCSIKGMPEKVKEGFLAPYDSPANRVATTRFVQDIPLTANDPSYDEIVFIENSLEKFAKTPILICFGRKDFVFGRHFFNEWKKRFPQAIARSFHAGHYLLEDVGDKVFATIKDFINKQ